jgi:HK97 family phage prohead protease
LGGFKEKLRRGCFSKSLSQTYKDPLCLYGHDGNQILGRVSSGTLTLTEDEVGLKFVCKLPDTSVARDLTALMSRGDLKSMSFGFTPTSDDWDEVGGQIIRTLLEVTLFEVSVVGQPAYTSTVVDLRSAPKALRSKLKRDDDEDESDDDICDPTSPNYDPDACDDDDDSEEDRCSCECAACQGCTNQDQTRQANLDLLLRRLRA